MYAKINPVTIFPTEAEIIYCPNLRIKDIGNLATVEIVWELQSSLREVLKSGVLYMNHDDYNAWGAENSYIFDWIASKLGLAVTEYIDDVPSVTVIESNNQNLSETTVDNTTNTVVDNNTVTDNTVTDSVVTDVVTDNTLTDSVVTDNTVTDNAVTDNAVTDSVVTDVVTDNTL